MAQPQLDHLAQARDWLAERVKACEATEGALSGRMCADSVVTVRKKKKTLYLIVIITR